MNSSIIKLPQGYATLDQNGREKELFLYVSLPDPNQVPLLLETFLEENQDDLMDRAIDLITNNTNNLAIVYKGLNSTDRKKLVQFFNDNYFGQTEEIDLPLGDYYSNQDFYQDFGSIDDDEVKKFIREVEDKVDYSILYDLQSHFGGKYSDQGFVTLRLADHSANSDKNRPTEEILFDVKIMRNDPTEDRFRGGNSLDAQYISLDFTKEKEALDLREIIDRVEDTLTKLNTERAKFYFKHFSEFEKEYGLKADTKEEILEELEDIKLVDKHALKDLIALVQGYTQ